MELKDIAAKIREFRDERDWAQFHNPKDSFRKDDDVRWQWSGATWTTPQGCPEGERGGVHQFGVPLVTVLRGSAFQKSEGTLRVVSEKRDNNANFAWVQHFIHHVAA